MVGCISAIRQKNSNCLKTTMRKSGTDRDLDKNKLFNLGRIYYTAIRIINSFSTGQYQDIDEIQNKIKKRKHPIPRGRLENYLIRLTDLGYCNMYNRIPDGKSSVCCDTRILYAGITSTDKNKIGKSITFFTPRKYWIECSKCHRGIAPSDDQYRVGSANVWSLTDSGFLAAIMLAKNVASLYTTYSDKLLAKICYFCLKNGMKDEVERLQKILREEFRTTMNPSKHNIWLREAILKIKNITTTDPESLKIHENLPISIPKYDARQ